MTKTCQNEAAAGSATQPITLRLLALFGVLLAALLVTPVQAQDAAAGAMTSVNINTADAGALAEGLVGVGPSRAEDIVRYREAFGPFTTVEQLTEVKGLGQSTLDKNRARITLE